MLSLVSPAAGANFFHADVDPKRFSNLQYERLVDPQAPKCVSRVPDMSAVLEFRDNGDW
jgi:hypothetical protein